MPSEEKGFEIVMPTQERHVRWSDAHLSEFYQQFRTHAEKLETHMDREEKQLRMLMDAFPNRDPIEHRKYHEKLMEAADAQKQFWQDLRLDLAKKATWAIVIAIIGLLVIGLGEHLKNLVK